MKIVQISPYAIGRHGGVQTHVRDLSDWLRSQGHEVRIISPPSGEQGDEVEGVTLLGQFRTASVHGTSFELTRANRADLAACVAELHDWGAEVVHLHTPWVPMMCWQLWRRLKLPTVATFHATLPEDKGFDPVSWFLRRAANHFNTRVTKVVVPSIAPQQQWREAGADPVPDILPPTINLSRWREARQAHSNRGKDAGFHVVCMGRLEERKGLFVLLEAWRQISAQIPGARLTIAGKGELESAVRAKVSADKLTGVTILPPPSYDDAPALIASADIFVAAALGGESFGLVLIEAMAAGVLPVASANDGFASVLTGRGVELLFAVGDSVGLAQKVVTIAKDRAHMDGLKTWATTHANSFDVATVGPVYVQLFQSALD